MTTEKSRETRLRAAAKRQGYMLVKSRRRDPMALDYGLYVLVTDTKGNHINRYGGQEAVSAFAHGDGMTLDEVMTYLVGDLLEERLNKPKEREKFEGMIAAVTDGEVAEMFPKDR